MVADYQEQGERLRDRFNAGRGEQEWYYRGLVLVLCNRLNQEPTGSILHQFNDTVEGLFGRHQVE